MAKGKILLLLFLAVAAYFFYASFFASSFEQGLQELRELEQRTGAQSDFLIPITTFELQSYKKGLEQLKAKHASVDSLKTFFDIKNSLLAIQQNLLEITQNFEQANKISPNCGSDSKLGIARELTRDTLTKIDSVLNKRNAFLKRFPKESVLVEEISRIKFEHTLAGVKKGVEQIQKIISTYC